VTSDIRASERRVLEAATLGAEADLRPDLTEVADASQASSWGRSGQSGLSSCPGSSQERVKPSVPIPEASASAEPGFWGSWTWRHSRSPFHSGFGSVSFEEIVTLRLARVPALGFLGCHVPGINAEQLATRGDLELSDGFSAHGKVRLLGARIGGQLNCGGGSFKNPGGHALSAEGADITGGVFLDKGFSAKAWSASLEHRSGWILFAAGRPSGTVRVMPSGPTERTLRATSYLTRASARRDR